MFNVAHCGKKKRLDRIITNNRMLIVPIDDSLIFGPFDGLADLSTTIKAISRSMPSAILGYKGSYSILSEEASNYFQIPFIINVTASTTSGKHLQKIKSCSIREAEIMGADCIAAHVNFFNQYENEMIYNLANIISKADELGMPTLTIAYPRGVSNDGKDYNFEEERDNNIDSYTRRICHCVRVSVELGTDIVKTQYTGSVPTFQRVVDSALGKPVIIAGGPVISISKSYQMAKDAINAGAAGVSYGRNVFNAENIEAYMAGIKAIVFNNASVEEALNIYKGVVENAKLE